MSDNFYILLELDSDMDDWGEIEKVIKQKQQMWTLSLTQISAEKRPEVERKLKLVPDMKKTLRDRRRRRAIADEARRERAALRKKQLDELDSYIEIITDRTIDEKTVKELSRRTGIEPADIVQRLKEKGISVGTEKRKVRPQLHSDFASQIRSNLGKIGEKDLYAFLGRQPSSTPEALHAAARSKYEELRRQPKDGVLGLRQVIAGQCLSVFKNETEKKRYDNTLRFEPLQALIGRLEIAGIYKYLTAHEIEKLVAQGTREGVDREVTLEFIEAFASERNWKIELPAERPSERREGPTSIVIAGVSYSTPESLGLALSKDWNKAEFVLRQYLANVRDWVNKLPRQTQRLLALANMKPGRNPAPKEILAFIDILNPKAPLRFEDFELSLENIQSLGERAFNGEPSAERTLLSLHAHDILSAEVVGRRTGLGKTAKEWRKAASGYYGLLGRLPSNISRPGTNLVMVPLLAASTPGSLVREELMRRAEAAATQRALACSWFKRLSSDQSIESMAIIPHVKDQAEAEVIAEEKRKEDEENKKQYERVLKVRGRIAHSLIGVAIGLWVGVIVAIIPGIVVYGIIEWIWSELAAMQVFIFWLFFCAVAGACIYAGYADHKLRDRFGNSARDPGRTKRRTSICSILSLLSIGLWMLFVIDEFGETYTEATMEYEREEGARIASLAAHVWATTGSCGEKRHTSTFKENARIKVCIETDGDFEEDDALKAMIEGRNVRRVAEVPSSEGQKRWELGVLPPGVHYTVKVSTMHGTLASNQFLVGRLSQSARAERSETSLRLSRETTRLIQSGLLVDGFDPGLLDGKLGKKTRSALRAWQKSRGVEPTGYLTKEQSLTLANLGKGNPGQSEESAVNKFVFDGP